MECKKLVPRRLSPAGDFANLRALSPFCIPVLGDTSACVVRALGEYHDIAADGVAASYVDRTVDLGHVWTTPALQEESDVTLAVGCKSCVRPDVAAHDRWP